MNSTFKKIAAYIRIAAGLLIASLLLMPLATGLKMVVKSSGGNVVTTYKSAYTLIFGGNLVSEHITYTVEKASVLGVISFAVLAISLASIIVHFMLFRKNEKISKILLAVCLTALLAGSIMMLCMHQAAASQLANAITGSASSAVKNTIYNNTHLMFGFIGPGIFGLFGSLALIVSFFFDGTVDEIRAKLFSK